MTVEDAVKELGQNNVLQLYLVADYEAQTFNYEQN